MKRLILSTIMIVASAAVYAQEAQQVILPAPVQQPATVRFGYFSYDKVLQASPDYIVARHNMSELRSKYDAEMKRAGDEFNSKYEEFLSGQRDFAKPILEKRQAELQDLMDKNLAFKQKAEQLLRQAEQDAYGPVYSKISEAVQKVGQERGYAFILNTDNNSVPYVNSTMGEDVSALIIDYIK